MKQAECDHSRANLYRAPVKGHLPHHLRKIGSGPLGTDRQSGGKAERHQVVLRSPYRLGAWSFWTGGVKYHSSELFSIPVSCNCSISLFSRGAPFSHAGSGTFCVGAVSSITTFCVITTSCAIIACHCVRALCVVLLHWLCTVHICNNRGVRQFAHNSQILFTFCRQKKMVFEVSSRAPSFHQSYGQAGRNLCALESKYRFGSWFSVQES